MSTDITKFHGSNLFKMARSRFEKIPDSRSPGHTTYPLSDILMSALAIYVLKFPSLLKFDQWGRGRGRGRGREEGTQQNMENVFGVSGVCSDTRMREVLDEVDPAQLDPLFDDYFNLCRRQKKIYPYERLGGFYPVSIDGSQVYTSDEVSCDNCLKKLNKKDNTVTYSHKMLAASYVHPTDKNVVPMGCEMIEGFDTKKEAVNDCEQNAFYRYLDRLKASHPKLKIMILADALHTTTPTLKKLKELGFSYVLNAKPGAHPHLFKGIEKRKELGQAIVYQFEEEIGDKIKKKRVHYFEMSNNMIINSQGTEDPVNFLNYKEVTTWTSPKKVMKCTEKKFSWVTDLTLSTHNCMEVMRAGRARWQIENETFNTLKNQGYELEHNFGHGEKNLCSVFSKLCLLAFSIDQLQRLGCKVMQAVQEKVKRFSYYVDRLRGVYREFNTINSWDQVLRIMLGEVRVEVIENTS